MTKAYKAVMDPEGKLKPRTLDTYVKRFFNNYNLRAAMASTPGRLGIRAMAAFERFKASERLKLADELGHRQRKRKGMPRASDEEIEEIKQKDDKTLWLESLNVNQTPASLTVYGTGQFLCYVAVKEIMDRQKEIKAKGLSALEKSALTPTIISAIKTAAAMILPYAPAPTDDERKQMSKAAILLGLFPDDITENPDDFTAPAPSTVDVESTTKE